MPLKVTLENTASKLWKTEINILGRTKGVPRRGKKKDLQSSQKKKKERHPMVKWETLFNL